MRDKRPVDELSIEELERILTIKKREARQKQLDRMKQHGRVIDNVSASPAVLPPENIPAPASNTPLVVEEDEDEFVVVDGRLVRVSPATLKPNPVQTQPTPVAPKEPSKPAFDDGTMALETTALVDDPPPAVANRKVKKAKKSGGSKAVDRLLLVVEMAAVVGVVVIGINMVSAIGKLEEETASAQAVAEANRQAVLPTLQPTPTVRMENFVLPSGHTFAADGSAQFNYQEVPSHLLSYVESQWVRPVAIRAPQTSQTALEISIPALNLRQGIVQGVDWEALKLGIGQLVNGVNPGDPEGNVVLSGHNDIYGELFRDLDQLRPGDRFEVRTQTNTYIYEVRETHIVDPDEVWVLENREGATVTLISCYPYRVNSQRIVVFADRVS